MKAVVFKGPHKVEIEDRMYFTHQKIYVPLLTKSQKALFPRSKKMEISLSRLSTQHSAAGMWEKLRILYI